jgi:hypothetical protein
MRREEVLGHTRVGHIRGGVEYFSFEVIDYIYHVFYALMPEKIIED